MTMQDSIERYKQAGHQAYYHWWDPDRSEDMLRQLAHEQHRHAGSYLRTYLGLTEDGQATAWLCLYSADHGLILGFDTSHPCPPFCL